MEIVKAFNTNKLHTDIVIKGTIEEPLFRASDIGEILEISNIRSAIQHYDETERHVVSIDTSTGSKEVNFLTEKGLYKVLFKSRKPIAETFQNWVCEVIKEIRLKGAYTLQQQFLSVKEELENTKQQNTETQNKLEETKKENIVLQQKLEESTDNVPTIYIWNTNTHLQQPELKIGITLNVHKRVKPYKQINKNGKIEFSIPILNVDVKMFEKVIHSVLHSYRLRDEVFQIDVEEAKLVIINFVNFIKLTQISNPGERLNKIQKVYEHQHIIINNVKNNVSTNEIGTQTEEQEETELEKEMKEIQTQNKKKETERIQIFYKYIEECCILRPDVEVSSTEILGHYRIWSKSAHKEIYHELKTFLDTKFKQCRLSIQDKNQIVNGYKGIKLKEIIYKKQLIPCDVETFVFNSTTFCPNGKVLHANLSREYKSWKESTGKEVTNNEDEELKHYLKLSGYTLFTTIWSNTGSGQGYYGVSLKSEEMNNHHKTSSTGKKVEKRKVETNELLGNWETIAKAAESEKISNAKMSRSIKTKTIFNNDYFFICT